MPQYDNKRANINVDERLIVALDCPSFAEAKDLVDLLENTVKFYKVGLELFMAGNYLDVIEWLIDREKKVFVDLKFFDIPNTVYHAVEQLNKCGATFATVHGNDSILEAAARAKKEIKILAVTVLTSLDRGDLTDMGFSCDPEKLVLSRAKRALQIGCDGVISSGLEAPALRKACGSEFIIVTPGIRPIDNKEEDDQKRTVDVEEAFERGADYIVVGRPIRTAENPKAIAAGIQKRIAAHFS